MSYRALRLNLYFQYAVLCKLYIPNPFPHREAILLSDPEKPRPEQNVYLARGIGKPDVQEMLNMERDGSHTFPLETFCSLVQKGLLKRSTPVNSKGL